jgi:hypothetical protein
MLKGEVREAVNLTAGEWGNSACSALFFHIIVVCESDNYTESFFISENYSRFYSFWLTNTVSRK